MIGSSTQWRPLALLVLGLAILLTSGVDARSPHPPPLRRITTTSAHLSILPRKAPPPSKKNGYLSPRFSTPLPPPPPTLKHSDSLILSLDLPDLLPFEVKMLVHPSEYLFHPEAKVSYGQSSFGSERLRQEDWRLYTGSVIAPYYVDRLTTLHSISANLPESEKQNILGRASVMVHHPGDLSGHGAVWEGSFEVLGEMYNVMTRDKYDRIKTTEDVAVEGMGEMVVFRQSDMRHDNATSSSCSHDNLHFNDPHHNPLFRPASPLTPPSLFAPLLDNLWKRDDTAGGMDISTNYIDSINSTSGCPNTQKIVYMGVALDCTYIASYGSTDAARTQVLNDWNQVSALYKQTFNISIGIIELQVQNLTCPTTAVTGEEWNVGCSDDVTLDERLSRFSAWRGNKGDDGAGLWHLMSACPTDSEVGVAWLGTLCQTDSSTQSGQTVSGTGISTATKTEWSLVSHEIGHGFGAIHDCTSGCSLSGSCCPLSKSTCDADSQFIMNPTTSSSETKFSGCTLGNICTNIGNRQVSTSCIENPGARSVISLQQCGNGIVEDGEDCDPGGNSTSACCDSSTCKFISNAKCDPSNSACCTSSCQYAAANTTCRAAVDPTCDFAETCPGDSADCPEDKTADDGKSCGSDGLACAGGVCTSLNKQCASAGGSLGLTTACGQKDDTSCVVSCKDPNSTNQCVVLQTPLIDGSSCGYAGHCYNSTCEKGSWQDTAAAWYKQNLQISIPVTIVAALLFLALVVAICRCIARGCTGNRGAAGKKYKGQQVPTMAQYPPPPAPPGMMASAPPPPPAGGMNGAGVGAGYGQQQGYDYGNGYGNGYGGGYGQGGYPQQQQGGGWVDERTYNGQNYGRHEAYGR
ncbi:hypothetical protein B9479_006357 [Cryptococcus floricola]|uniref:Disintegrin and metalloproteinase domain-containing protein B n=1 Tax=Cryptococcus floricola TaxID=2591691 RepID=A0A5D3ANE5_9TREE|nr:hypothetical protein B9479_006357 [Cryptococcus floricola]